MTTSTEISFAGFDFAAVVEAERASRPLPFLRREDVLRAYSGKPGCACGCRGRYYCPASTPEAARNSADVNEAQVTRIVSTINASARTARRMTGFDGEQIVSLETATRLFIVYCRPGADVSAFEVEAGEEV